MSASEFNRGNQKREGAWNGGLGTNTVLDGGLRGGQAGSRERRATDPTLSKRGLEIASGTLARSIPGRFSEILNLREEATFFIF